MNTNYTFIDFDRDASLSFAKEFAKAEYSTDLEIVLLIAISDQKNLPTLYYKSKDPISFKEYIEKWARNYIDGYNNRPSVKKGNKPGTFPDYIIKLILEIATNNIEKKTLDAIAEGHSLMMTIENLTGYLLEEYLSVKLKENGWYCCWGASMVSVDFCKEDGSLLQVKNSDNSENSSSGAIRNGTKIKKWARRNSKKEGKDYWPKLNEIVGRTDLNEKDFEHFVITTVKKNPECLDITGYKSLIPQK